jgi:hypothetical protein
MSMWKTFDGRLRCMLILMKIEPRSWRVVGSLPSASTIYAKHRFIMSNRKKKQ